MSDRRSAAAPARRAVVRWSWRMFRREWRQQALVLALMTVAVGVSVTGASLAMNAAAVSQPEFGSATAMSHLEETAPGQAAQQVAAARRRFGPVEVIRHWAAEVPGSARALDVRAQDPDGRFGRSMLALRHGRYPRAGEVALTRSAADLLSVDVGDRVTLLRVSRPVVGIVEDPSDLDDQFALVPTGERAPHAVVTLLFDRRDDARGQASGGSGGADFQGGVMVRGDNGPVAALVLIAVTLAMALVGLIAAAGFVVVAHRRQRQLGLLAAIGAGQRHLRLVVVANGAIVGAVAAAVGGVAGVAGWVAAAPALEQAIGHRIGRFDLPWALIAGCLLIAVAMAALAAWWPARVLARLPIMAALSGRPPEPSPVHRSLVVAAVLLGAGVAAIASANPTDGEVRPPVLIGGVLAVVIGTVFAAPAAIRLAAVPAGRLPFAGRLAVRDLARHQARAAAALAAITLALGISVTVVGIANANQDRADEGNLASSQILVSFESGAPQPDPTASPGALAALDAKAARVAHAIGAPAPLALDLVVPTSTSKDPTQHELISVGRVLDAHSTRMVGLAYVATPAVLRALGIDPSSIDPKTDLLSGGATDLVLVDTSTRGPSADVVQRVDLPPYSDGPRYLVTEAAVRRHNWERHRAGWLVDTGRALTGEQIAAARSAAARSGLVIETRSSQGGLAVLRLVATGIGAFLSLAIVAMTVGLIRSESARDVRTLTATGASSRTRRSLTASTAGVLALLGVGLGTGGAYAALVAAFHGDLGRLAPLPWPQLVALGVGLPLLAASAGFVLAGRDPERFARQTFD